MTVFRDPTAPKGRVVFGGESFVDGVTADIKIGPETALLFKSAGITDVEPVTPEPDEAQSEPDKPAPKRRK